MRNEENRAADIEIAKRIEVAASCADFAIDDELTRGRIRSIYAQLQYGDGNVNKISRYYGLPRQLIIDIKRGKIFRNIINGL